MEKPVKLSDKEIKAIEATLAKGERVELIPVKDGAVKVVRVRRDEIKQPEPKSGRNTSRLGVDG